MMHRFSTSATASRRTFVGFATAAVASALLGLAAPAALAQSKGEIRIAHVYSKTGPLEAYGKQTQTGLMMGLDYATNGTMTVAGRKIVVIEKDDQGKPDVGKSLLAAAYGDDKADLAVGPTSSGVALALLPVAEEYKKILLVEPAVADSITGDKWNKYIFRTGRNSSQDAISQRGRARQGQAPTSRPWRRTTPSAATASRPSRTRSRRPRSSTRNTCRRRPPTSPPVRSA